MNTTDKMAKAVRGLLRERNIAARINARKFAEEALAAYEAEAKPAPADRLGSVRCPKCWEMMSVPAAPALVSLTDDQIREVFLANGFTVKEGQTDLKPYVFAAARALLAKTLVAPAAPAPSADLCERICAAIVAEDTKSVDEAGYMLDSNDCCRIVREQFAAAPAAPAPVPLTDEEVRRGWGTVSLHPHVDDRFTAGVRFAERAHGIGKGGAA